MGVNEERDLQNETLTTGCGERATGKTRELQLAELELMNWVVDCCDRYNLRYYLLGGTLLGAVRHKGFIPWDDDVDICMPRPDYMKFLEIAETELFGTDMRIDSMYHDSEFRYGLAQVTTSRMQIINRSATVEHVQDAWIDIIPMDGFPKGGLAVAIHKTRLMWWKIMDATSRFERVVDVKRDRGLVGNVAVKAFGAFCKVVHPYGKNSNRPLMNTERALMRFRYDDSPNVINLYAAQGFKEIFPNEAFGNGTDVEFEGRMFTAPSDIHTVLCRIYDENYMTPPPEKERNYHHSEVL
ncbi:MAG: LicD family protein [Eggerthellaceae bacterium]|nr:LicD family protein [Eggerthellaceae bacterium]